MLGPDDLERLAQTIHRRFRAATPLPPGHPADVPWEDLAEPQRAQNRDQAAEDVRRIHAAGYRLVPLADGGTHRITALPEDLVESLALAEHDRWAATARAHGYRWGPQRIDDPPDRRHPDLVAWEQLDEPAREKDRRPARDLPALFAEAGWALVPAQPV